MRRTRVGCCAAAVRIAAAALAKLRGVTRPSTRSGPMTPSALLMAPADAPPFAPSASTATCGSVPFALRAASMLTPSANARQPWASAFMQRPPSTGAAKIIVESPMTSGARPPEEPPWAACTLVPSSQAYADGARTSTARSAARTPAPTARINGSGELRVVVVHAVVALAAADLRVELRRDRLTGLRAAEALHAARAAALPAPVADAAAVVGLHDALARRAAHPRRRQRRDVRRAELAVLAGQRALRRRRRRRRVVGGSDRGERCGGQQHGEHDGENGAGHPGSPRSEAGRDVSHGPVTSTCSHHVRFCPAGGYALTASVATPTAYPYSPALRAAARVSPCQCPPPRSLPSPSTMTSFCDSMKLSRLSSKPSSITNGPVARTLPSPVSTTLSNAFIAMELLPSAGGPAAIGRRTRHRPSVRTARRPPRG